MSESVRLLALKEAFESIRGDLAKLPRPVEPVLFRAGDHVTFRGHTIHIEEAKPEVAWYSTELFACNLDKQFLRTALVAPSVRWVQSGRAGFDAPGFGELARKGVLVTASNAPAPAMAEYVIAGVLDRFQRGPERRAAQAAAQWKPFPFREISDSRWLVLGFGSIGHEVARRARAFGSHVTGVRRSGGIDVDADAIVTPDDMEQAMSKADVVVVSLPINRHTAGMIDKKFLLGLKPGSLLVNVGRGELIDENALHDALDTGQLSGAILDVTKVEPLPPDHWMWSHEAVTITAHTSGRGSRLLERNRSLLIENLGRWMRGERLLNEVPASDMLDARLMQ